MFYQKLFYWFGFESHRLRHSRQTYLLIQAALDFWNDEGHLRFGDALKSLDDENLLALIRAILYWREISTDILWNEELC
jgi:hypothetical protein